MIDTAAIFTNEIYNRIGRSLLKNFRKRKNERLYLLLFDESGRRILKKSVARGDKFQAVVNLERISKYASLKINAAAAVLAHNHPSGALYASYGDMAATADICALLCRNNIVLWEHYIIAGNAYIGFFNHEKMLCTGGEC